MARSKDSRPQYSLPSVVSLLRPHGGTLQSQFLCQINLGARAYSHLPHLCVGIEMMSPGCSSHAQAHERAGAVVSCSLPRDAFQLPQELVEPLRYCCANWTSQTNVLFLAMCSGFLALLLAA